jgi:surface antigen
MLWRGFICFGVLALACTASLGQGSLGFLLDSPVARFTSEDKEMLRSAARELLDSAAKPGERVWKNPATGHHGKVKLLGAFHSSDGRDCRRLQLDNFADGLESSSRYSVCRDASKQWRLDPDAKPPKKSV